MSSPKAKSVTLRDVAAALGIHVSTVSRALDARTQQRVSTAVREQVRQAADRLGYQPNAAAYSLRTSRTRTVGVIVPDITDPVFPPIIRGIEEGLERHGYVAVLGNTDGDVGREAKLVSTLISRGVDGFIVASLRRHDATVAKLTAERPVVTVTRSAETARFSSVVHDESDGIRRILTHLAALGHRAIGSIAGPGSVSTGFERLRAFRSELQALGMPASERLIVVASKFTEEDGERCTEELLARGVPFTALVCANDRLAIGAIAALQRNGLACPGDVSVTGFNDMALAARLAPPLTTVRLQHHRAGLEAAEILIDTLEGRSPEPRHVVLPTEFVIRGSTRSIRETGKTAGKRPPSRTARTGVIKSQRG
jgi:LacI family transcriptional regulator